jgi:predicted DNA-binding transcriptional regulator AlpA
MSYKFNKLHHDRIVREAERKALTTISRSQAWVQEQKGLFPKRVKLSQNSVGWRLSDLLEWIESREAV